MASRREWQESQGGWHLGGGGRNHKVFGIYEGVA